MRWVTIITVVSCYGTLDITASSKTAHILESYEAHGLHNLLSLHYTYSIRVIGTINALPEQPNSSPNILIFMKAV